MEESVHDEQIYRIYDGIANTNSYLRPGIEKRAYLENFENEYKPWV
jgi:hypothetical protein